MIDLTPLEVRKKKGDFRRAMRGYDAQSVDDFLELVADRLEELVRENAAMHERIVSSERNVADYRDRERALTEALVTAQEMREEMRRQMEKEVELKRREAEADAEAMRADAAAMREREEENVRRLRARQSQFVQSYRAFLERELSEISVMTETLDFQTPEPPRRKKVKRPEPASAPVAPAPVAPAPKATAPETAAPESVPAPAPAPEIDNEPFEREPVDPDLLSFSDEPFEHEMSFEPMPAAPQPVAPAPANDEELFDLNAHLPPEPVVESELLELQPKSSTTAKMTMTIRMGGFRRC